MKLKKLKNDKSVNIVIKLYLNEEMRILNVIFFFRRNTNS